MYNTVSSAGFFRSSTPVWTGAEKEVSGTPTSKMFYHGDKVEDKPLPPPLSNLTTEQQQELKDLAQRAEDTQLTPEEQNEAYGSLLGKLEEYGIITTEERSLASGLIALPGPDQNGHFYSGWSELGLPGWEEHSPMDALDYLIFYQQKKLELTSKQGFETGALSKQITACSKIQEMLSALIGQE